MANTHRTLSALGSNRRIAKRVSAKLDSTNMRGGTTKFKVSYGEVMIPITQEIVLGVDDYRDMYVSKFVNARVERGVSTLNIKLTVHGNEKSAIEYIRKSYANRKMFSYGVSNIVIDCIDTLIEVCSNHNNIEFRIHGTFNDIDKERAKILMEFDEIIVFVRWVYDQHGSSASVPLDAELAPVDEMYPWLNGESLESYFERYQKSNASILILLGAPGTGKTSFIRGYLLSTKSSALVTYDTTILKGDTIFSEFIEGDANALVIEDADMFLSSRKDGNDMMHKFLSVGDGLVTVRGKKLIFSTNLPSIKDIDPALLRPGRTFDVIAFNELNVDEARTLAEKIDIEFNPDASKTSFTIAEIYNSKANKDRHTYKSQFGFI